MRTLVGTFLLGTCLVASPALAQWHPWVASCVYTKSCTETGSVGYSQASQDHYKGPRASLVRVH
jgi:hypothetical protein